MKKRRPLFYLAWPLVSAIIVFTTLVLSRALVVPATGSPAQEQGGE